MLVTMQLRPFVAVEVTRRAYLRGAGLFVLTAAVGVTVLVVAGPALVPVLLAEGLLGLGPYGATVARLLPYGLALAVTLVAAGLVAAMGERELRNTAIRPATT